MYRYNNKAKIPLNNRQTPKQQRTRVKNGSQSGEGTKERGRIKEGRR
jgi:hypothetical protein